MIDNELFVDVPGYEGIQINKLGQVKRLAKEVNNRWGRKSLFKERALTPYQHVSGYIYVQLGARISAKQHRLLALTFIPNPNNYDQVNHINGIRNDNRLENLEWCNCSMNAQHAFDIGLRKALKGAENPMFNRRGSDSPHFGKTRGQNYGAKLVIDLFTGIFYDCLQDAADAKGYKSIGVLRHRLTGILKNNTGLIYA